ncbi:TlpA family protein disulfide reductase [Ureibacillus sp. 179-F W5.1 NHS]|uniref:TlpA family protein disulfide reductase n=1 Tax=Lysinibacillus halotolerans TaxID=1368476 RepID=A0A3M8H571_9BACI|nr:TlpA disulfide reductase family protein [Lysinibacillus halotolerans]RNC97575.1 TlpA family protein disulfide reductase [Lysinibacillus halotolerans]
MRKQLLSAVLTGLIVIVLFITIYTNMAESKGTPLTIDEAIQSNLLQELPSEDEGSRGDNPTISYRIIEEPVIGDTHGEEGHAHAHDHNDAHEEGSIQPEVRTMNTKAPDFEMKTLAGDTVKLSNLKGKKIFINFWATWCPPCVEEMPTIQHFYESYAKEHNVEILSVNATDLETNKEKVKQFANKHGITFPILLDEDGNTSIAYEVLTIPTSIIVNEEGIIVEQIIGPVTEELLLEKLSK